MFVFNKILDGIVPEDIIMNRVSMFIESFEIGFQKYFKDVSEKYGSPSPGHCGFRRTK